jgi:undecaprenyl diphosphate synthase
MKSAEPGKRSRTTAAPADLAGAGLHVAIIMDGNGRWAHKRHLPRVMGHRSGVNALKRTVEGAPALGVTTLTVFGFSTENWNRPVAEVSELMALLRAYIDSDLERLTNEGVRLKIMGQREGLDIDIQKMIDNAEQRTRDNDLFQLQVAFNYGGQADIVEAARRLALEVARGELDPDQIDEASFASRLWTAGAPPVDLVVRTSGEQRLSNFLLWDCAYAELVFQDVLWPDYGPLHLKAAIEEFRTRDRRFGALATDNVFAAS